jgi:hypothetical protein
MSLPEDTAASDAGSAGTGAGPRDVEEMSADESERAPLTSEERTVRIVSLPSRSGDRFFGRRGAEELVEEAVSVDKLRQKLGEFLRTIQEMLAEDQPATGAFQLNQIQFSAEISADGEFKLLGTGVGISTGSTITFVLERTTVGS